MIKRLLTFGMACSAIFCGVANDELYHTEDLGDMNGVSDNGKYAAISDTDNKKAYLWDSNTPDLFIDITPELGDPTTPSGQRIKGASANDVSDHGLVVGAIFYADGKSYPAIYDGNEWTRLEIPADAQNSNECVAITPDGGVITGYSCKVYTDYDGTTNGQYYPIQWKRNAQGEYELISYHDLDYYDHQGFFPSCMNTRGNVIGGTLYCGVASTVPALIVDGKLVLFDEITWKEAPFTYYFDGVLKYYCGNDAEGHQIWTTDPNDPNIILYREPYIDGVHDTDMDGAFIGGFTFCDSHNNFYGYRTRVASVDDDGENAKFNKGAALYNFESNEWSYNARSSYYTCGTGEGLIFANNNTVYVDGEKEQLSDEYDLRGLPSASTGIAKCSINGKVLGGVREEFVEAIGDFYYFPYIILCDGAYDSVKTIGLDSAAVIAGHGYISATSGEAHVYDMNGRIVGSGSRVSVAPGMYIVNAGGKSIKVVVR